ncbi:hypothetical protein C8R47DRAFT_730676 [Mycena vitilis]|nr:hypothetical protein C8R47DRAFT_730676 [Mycena vitilis]
MKDIVPDGAAPRLWHMDSYREESKTRRKCLCLANAESPSFLGLLLVSANVFRPQRRVLLARCSSFPIPAMLRNGNSFNSRVRTMALARACRQFDWSFSLQSLRDHRRSQSSRAQAVVCTFWYVLRISGNGESMFIGNHHLLHEIRHKLVKTDGSLHSDYASMICNQSVHFNYKSPALYGCPETSEEYWSLMLDAGRRATSPRMMRYFAVSRGHLHNLKRLCQSKASRRPIHPPLPHSASLIG